MEGVTACSFILHADFQVFPAVIGAGEEEVVVKAGVVVVALPFLIRVIQDCLRVCGGFAVNIIGNARFGVKVIVILLSCVNDRTGNWLVFF